MLRTIFVLSSLLFVNNAFADEDPNLDIDLEAIHAAPQAEENQNTQRKADFNALDEEDEFEMDLSNPTTPATEVINPDAELTMETTAITEPNELSMGSDSLGMDVMEEPAAVDPAAKDIDWSLDLSEDMEIGDTKISPKVEKKSEPVNLDFLDE